MYPQTHVYFAETVLKKQGDIITLGSILPDLLIGGSFNHYEAHSKGTEIYNFLKEDSALRDFGMAVLTHGFDPRGLDYYGDEKYLDFEKGYCFEKARPFIRDTIKACNIPPEMGWWKAHNIIEMGVELLVSSYDGRNERIKEAFTNRGLVVEVNEIFRDLWKDNSINFTRRVEKFMRLVELERASVEALANKFQVQMHYKHKLNIDVKEVAGLIEKAAESVSEDLHSFMKTTAGLVGSNVKRLITPAQVRKKAGV